ncbi:MAG: hypothetical protein AAFN63_14530 [Pseudomonadota bacterium]
MTLKLTMAAMAAACLSTVAQAQNIGEISVGVGVTNFGFSLQGEYDVAPQVAVRGMIMGGFSIDDTFEVDDAEVDGDAELGGVAILADYYPLSNPWRVSGGLFFSTTEISGDVTDGLLTYEGEVALTNEIAPMITTGFNTDIAPGWALSGDIGMIISSLEVSSDDDDADVQDEIDELNSDLEDLPVLPFIGFAVSYTY